MAGDLERIWIREEVDRLIEEAASQIEIAEELRSDANDCDKYVVVILEEIKKINTRLTGEDIS